MSSDVVQWISCELSKLLGTDADDAVARYNTYFLCLRLVSVVITYRVIYRVRLHRVKQMLVQCLIQIILVLAAGRLVRLDVFKSPYLLSRQFLNEFTEDASASSCDKLFHLLMTR